MKDTNTEISKYLNAERLFIFRMPGGVLGWTTSPDTARKTIESATEYGCEVTSTVEVGATTYTLTMKEGD